jgi:hypothetical protein
MPLSIGGSVSMAATVLAASTVDVSTVAGCLQVGTASGAASLVAAVSYLSFMVRSRRSFDGEAR